MTSHWLSLSGLSKLKIKFSLWFRIKRSKFNERSWKTCQWLHCALLRILGVDFLKIFGVWTSEFEVRTSLNWNPRREKFSSAGSTPLTKSLCLSSINYTADKSENLVQLIRHSDLVWPDIKARLNDNSRRHTQLTVIEYKSSTVSLSLRTES